ncbi:gluconate kinase, FGGY family [Cnuella takakiae]|uniref:Gluconate kinase, FGGY family n=1 Tax=Cnuella takakiae TaxID=1302690 RepID=A0A1M5HJ21_9BACT|nr:gluconokinase [Cnuella takakiae]OLY92888.1 hypothetical protein BUE76_14065 [Cnuella takakiae]SHG15927.1 gluconate kinase, FGGY family [Cnuella takakiae]
MQPYVLGIDIGTGSTKAVAVDEEGKVLLAKQAYYPAGFSHTEQDPQVIWKAFLQVVREVCQVLPPPRALSFSSAMHSIMALDQQMQPITSLLTWADDRAAAIATDLLRQTFGADLYRATGTPIHALSPLTKIKWWQQNDPALYERAHFFVGIKEYIWYRLFGVLETDYSLASATGLMNIQTLEWHESSLDFAGIKIEQLPKLVPTTHLRNQLTHEAAQVTGLPAATIGIIGASDGCLANLGTSALQPGTAAITIGTSGAVRTAGTKPTPVFPAQLFNYYLDEGCWITGGAINNGGAAIQWLAKTLGYDSIPEALIQDAGALAPGADGLLFLPFLLGERAPIWDSHSSAAFIGLQQKHGPAHLMRAVLEGICFALLSVLEPLERSAGKVDTLHLSGGFTRSAAALQILSDCLGKKVVLLQTEDASAIGAAMLGWKALGEVKGFATMPKPEQVKTFYPCATSIERYQQLYALYQPLYNQLKTTMHRLQDLA